MEKRHTKKEDNLKKIEDDLKNKPRCAQVAAMTTVGHSKNEQYLF